MHLIYFLVQFDFLTLSNFLDRSERYVDDLDLPLFDLPTISTATNGFSENNKIGEGGFGTVYKVIQYLRRKKNTIKI